MEIGGEILPVLSEEAGMVERAAERESKLVERAGEAENRDQRELKMSELSVVLSVGDLAHCFSQFLH